MTLPPALSSRHRRLTHSLGLPWLLYGQLFTTCLGRRHKLVLGILFAALLFSIVRYFGSGSSLLDPDTSSQADTRLEPLKDSSASDTSPSSPEVGRLSGGGDIGPTVHIHQLIRQHLTPPSHTVGESLQSVQPGQRRDGRRRRQRRGKRRGRGRRRGPRKGHVTDFSQHGQSAFVDHHLSGRRGGFYVESGASDGETGSNSLFFEIERNWTGLLVEGNPQSFASLLKRGRRAWALNACLSPTGDMTTVRFRPAGGIGGIVDHMPPGHRKLVDKYGLDDVNVTCFAFGDVIAALPVSPLVERIDYWSLDVEGAELPILGTIKWSDFIPIEVISVEYKIKDSSGRTDGHETDKKLTALRQFFAGTGMYRELGTINGVDVIFGRIEHEHKHTVIDASQQIRNSGSNQDNVSIHSKVEEEKLEEDVKRDDRIIQETNGKEEQMNTNDHGDDGGVEDGGGMEYENGDDGDVVDGKVNGEENGDDGGVEYGVEDGGKMEDENGDDGGVEDSVEDGEKIEDENGDYGGVEDGGEMEDEYGDNGGVEYGGEIEDENEDDGGVEYGGQNKDGNEDDR